MSDKYMELLKIVDDVLTYVNFKLQKLEKLRQELKEKVDEPPMDGLVWGTIAPASTTMWTALPAEPEAWTHTSGISMPEAPTTSVELIAGEGPLSMVNNVKRFLTNSTKHNGVISVQYIGRIGNYHLAMVHYFVKDGSNA